MLVTKINGLSVYIGEKPSFQFLLPTLHNVFLYLGVEKKQELYVKGDLIIYFFQVMKDSIYFRVNNKTLRIKEDFYQLNDIIVPYDKNLCLVNLVLDFIRSSYRDKL
jgi:hypothetical protein